MCQNKLMLISLPFLPDVYYIFGTNLGVPLVQWGPLHPSHPSLQVILAVLLYQANPRGHKYDKQHCRLLKRLIILHCTQPLNN